MLLTPNWFTCPVCNRTCDFDIAERIYKTAKAVEQSTEARIERALAVASAYGQVDGDHHKLWVIDQMVRELTGDEYEQWVRVYEGAEDDSDEEPEYMWDTGIAP